MRNSKGQFTVGHPPVNPRDKTTGRFLPSPRPEIVLKIPEPEPAPAPAPEPEKPKEETIIHNPRPTIRRPEW